VLPTGAYKHYRAYSSDKEKPGKVHKGTVGVTTVTAEYVFAVVSPDEFLPWDNVLFEAGKRHFFA